MATPDLHEAPAAFSKAGVQGEAGENNEKET